MATFTQLTGNAVIIGTPDADLITTGAGNDFINAGAGANTIRAGNGANYVIAGAGDDNILSGSGNDRISAGDGNNIIDAGDGFNNVTTGIGNDEITTGSGNDEISAGAGNNRIRAGAGSNSINTGNGNDDITSGAGNDSINAGGGNNIVNAGDGANNVNTGTGNDTITSGAGNDTINAGDGINTVTSGAGNDLVITGSGTDTIDTGSGADLVNSGGGNDVIRHRITENAGFLDQYDGNAGQDTLRLELTAAEWARPGVQADVAAFLARANPSAFFAFTSTNLRVVNIERLEVFVEGVLLTNPANEPVTAVADSISVTEDTAAASVNLLLNDSVPDRAASVTLLGTSTLGTATLVTSLAGAVQTATLSFVPNNASLQYLAQGQSVSETLQYRVQDINGDFGIANVTITVTGTNDAPVASAASFSVAEDAAIVSGSVSATDADANAVLSFALTGAAPAGLTFNTNGSYTFNAGNAAYQSLGVGQSTVLTIPYRVTDDRGATSSANLVITVTGTNDVPVASAASVSVAEDAAVLNGSVSATDADANAVLTFALNGVAPAGLSFSANGSYTFNAGNAAYQSLGVGQSAVLTVPYSVTDDRGASSSANLVITVTGTNDAPVASAASFSVAEDAAVITGSVSATDADANAALSYALNGTAPAGLTFNANGSYSFDPSVAAYQSLGVGQSAVLTVPYTVTDDQGATSSANLVITVTGTNDAPVASAAAVSVAEDAAVLNGSVSATDADANATLSYALNGNAPAGLTFNADGSYSFNAGSAAYQSLGVGQSAVLTIPYTVTDDQGATSSANLVITVTGTNDAPVASAAAVSVAEDAAVLNGSVSATDPDANATLSYALNGNAPAGLTFNADGSYSFNAGSAAYQSLGVGQSAVLTVPYTATDDQGATSSANLVITVTGTNDAPVASAASFSVAEDAAIVSGSVSASDADANAALSYALDGTAPAGLTFNVDGSYSFDPSVAAYQSLGVGQSAVLTVPYTVTDDQGATSSANLVITVTGTNDAPVASAAAVSVAEDAAVLNGSVSATDADANATLSYALNGNAPAGLTFNADGSYSFNAGSAAYQSLGVGQSAVLTIPYTVTDDQGATSSANLVITVTGTNDAPVASAAAVSVAEDAAVLNGSVSATDPDANATLSYALNGNAPAGLTFNADGSYSFNAGSAAYQSLGVGQSAVLTVPYTATDDQGATSSANLVITVTGTNDAPVASAASFSVAEDAAIVSGSVSASDADANAALSYALDGTAPAGLTFNVDGSYSFDPSVAAYQSLGVGQSAVLTIPYTVTDDQGATSSANLVITVTGTNDAPVASAAAVSVAEDAAVLNGSVSATDADANATLSYALNGNAPAGLTFNADGSYSFNAGSAAYQSLGVGQSAVLTVPYTATDDQGATSSANLVITVTGTNDAPVASAASISVAEDAAIVSGSVSASDADANAALSYALDGTAPAGLTFNVDGSYSFDPSVAAYQSLGVGQSAVLTIPYTVTDDQGATSSANLVITVTGTNDAPVASAAAVSVAEDAAVLNGSVSATDADANATLSYALNGNAPAGLTFNADGSYSFDPSVAAYQSLGVGQSAVLTIPYTVTDDQGATSSANLVITVTGTNDAPTLQAVAGISYTDTAVDDSFTAAGGTLVGQDADTGATLSYGIDGGTAGSYTVGADSFDVSRTGSYGTLYVNASTGVYRFVPDDGAIEALKTTTTETFALTVSDGVAVPTQQALVVTLNGANDTPEISVAGPIGLSTDEDTSVGGSISATDRDAGDTIAYTVSAAASNGSASVNPDGSYSYQPNANFFGTDSFTLQASDGAASDTVVVNVAVASVADTDTLNDDTGLSSTVLTLDGDLLVGTGITGQSGFHVATDAADAPGVELGLKAIVRFGGTYSLDPADTTGRTYLVDSGRVDQGPAGFNQLTPNDDGWARWNYLVSLGADTDSNGGSLRDQTYTFSITKLDGGGSPTTPAISFTLTQYLAGAVTAGAISQLQANAILDGNVFQDSVNLEFVPGIRENFDPRETGSFRISVTATDTQGVESLSNSIVVKIVNSAPVAVDDSFTTNEDTAITLTAAQLLGNDSDVNGQVLRIVSVGNAANGSVALNLDGTVTFTPNANYNGPASFDYVVGDGQVPELTDSGSVSIAVNAVNDSASFSGTFSGNVVEDTDTAFASVLTVTDADAGQSAPQPIASGTPGDNAYGTFEVEADGTWAYTLNNSLPAVQALAAGQTLTDRITVQSSDGSASQVLSVTITGTNDAPTLQAVAGISYTDTAVDDSFTAAGGTLVGQDADTGATLSYGIDGGTAGSYTVGADSFDVSRTGSYGTLYVNASTGVYRFVPDDGAIEALKTTTTETFALTVSDGVAVPTQQALVVTLNGANDTPEISVAGPIGLSTDEDTSVGGSISATDRDAGDTIAYTVSAAASNGSASVNPDGSYSYQPNANFFGTDSFTLQASDGAASDTVVVNVAVASVADTDTLNDDTGLSSTVLTLDGDLLVGTGITGQSGFHVATDAADAPGVELGLKAIVRFGGTYSLDPADTTGRTYLVDSGRVDQGPAGFNQLTPNDDGWARWNYLVSLGADTDSNGGSLRDQTYTFSITKLDGGGSPTTPAISFTLTQYLAGAVTAGAISQLQANAILDGNVFQDSVNLEFVPGIRENFDPRETGSFRISVTATDTQGVESLSNSIVVKIVNSAPVAVDDSFTTNEDTAITLTAAQLLGNDTDVNAQALRIVSVSNAANGSVVINPDGTVTFTPNANYNGPASFDYVVGDGQVPELTDTGSVGITVNAQPDDASIGGTTSGGVQEDTQTVFNGVLTVTDPDAGEAELQAIAGTAGANGYGSFVVEADGDWAYTLNNSLAAVQSLAAGQTLTDSITVSSEDGTDSQLLSVTITGTNDAPVIAAGSGMVRTDFGGNYDIGRSVVIQPDGKVIVAGDTSNGGTEDFALVRYLADGSLDESFGSGGKVVTAFGSSRDVGRDVVLQADGKIVVAGFTFTSGNYDFALSRYDANGQLDTGFGSAGRVVTGFGQPSDMGRSLAILSDGSIIVVGDSGDGSSTANFALARYDATGQLVTSFGTGGKVSTDFQSGRDVAESVVVQGDGKIVVAGFAEIGGVLGFALARYTTDGALDPGFGSGGKVTAGFGSSALARSVTLQDDGKIVLAGYVYDSVGNDFDLALVRLLADGTPDAGFGVGGKLVTSLSGGDDFGYAVVQAGGKILIAGSTRVGGTQDVALIRYNDNGTLDSGFGSNGRVTTAIGPASDEGYAISVQPDGRIVVAGQVRDGATSDIGVIRYNADGTLDTTFGVVQPAAAVQESADGAANENTAIHTATGTLRWTDVDTLDVHSVSFAPKGSGYLGTLSLAAVNQTADSVGWTYSVNDSTLDFLRAGEVRTQEYDVTVSDDKGGTAVQTVKVTITGTNDAPVISVLPTDSDARTLSETNAALSASGTLSVVDADLSDTVVASVVSVVASDTTTGLGSGTAALAAMLTVTPVAIASDTGDTHNLSWSFNSASETFDYLAAGEQLTLTYTVRATDSSATNAYDDQTVTITITGTNDAATITGTSSGAAQEDTTLSASGTLTVADIDTGEAEFQQQTNVAGTYGSFSITAAGAWSYDLANGTNGVASAVQSLSAGQTVTDTFTVLSEDGTASQAVTITITGTNDVPTLQAVSAIAYTDTAADDSFSAASGTLVGADIDSGTVLSYGIVGGTAGSYTVGVDSFDLAKTGAYGTLYVNASTGVYRFVPDDGAIEALKTTTTETFALTVSDGVAVPTQQALVVTLNGANDTPEISVAGPIGLSTDEDTSVGGSISATDRDAGDTIAYTVSAAASNGSASVNPDGSYSYQPNANFFGTDSFTLQASDGAASDTVVVNVAVASVADTDTLNDDTGLSSTVLTPDGDLLVGTGITGQSGFHVATDAADAPGVELGLKAIVRFGGTYSLDPTDGTGRTYLVDSGRVDQGPAGFNQLTPNDDGWARWNYLVSLGADTDSNGGSLRDQTYTFSITKLDGGGSPTTPAISFTLTQYLAGAVTAGAISQLQANAILDGNVFQDSVNLEFVPGIRENFDPRETGSFRISVTATDTQGVESLSNSIVVKIVNSAPVAVDDSFTTNEDTAITLTAAQLLGNDTDVNAQALRIVSVSNAANGSVVINPDGTVTFTPNANYNGPASFDYVIGDGQVPELTDTGSVTLTVNPQPDNATIGGTTSGTVTEDGAAFTGIAVVTDPDAGENELQPVTAGTPGINNYGSFGVLADGTWTYTLNNVLPAVQALSVGQSLSDSITVLSEDGTASQVLSVTINGSNDTPRLGFEQGFETDSAGVITGGSSGALTLVSSAPGIPAPAEGGQFALFTESGGVGGAGPFTRFDGYRTTFSDGLTAEVKVYLDVNWAAGSGFDYSVAANGSDGNHQRDFIFHVAKDTSTGQLIVAADNNTNFAVREDLDTLTNKVVVSNSGWYTLQHVFRNVGGVLAVDMNLIDASGNVLFTETRSAPADTIGVGGEVGGNRYGWFTDVTVPGGLGVDALSLGADSGQLSERSDGAADEGTATLTATNLIPFTDVDLADTHTLSVSGNATPGYLGTLAAVVEDAATADGRGMVRWTFNASDSALESLGAGQSVTQTYTVTVDDGQGGTASKTVSIVLTGSNDGASITGSTFGNVTEDGTQTAIGSLTVTDPDAGQSLLVPVPSGTAGANDYGTFEVSAAGDWVYTLGNALSTVQTLAAGQTVTDSITVQSADGTAMQTITVSITGTNDVPVITGTATGTVTEDLSLQATGTLTITDTDALQSSFQAITAPTAGANGYGSFTVTAAGAWTYDLNNANPTVQALKGGETLTDSIVVQSQDGTASETISVTIQGVSNINNVGAAAFVSSGAGFRIVGANSTDAAGFAVASAGDFNGDGFDDVVLTATGGDGPAGPARSNAGEAIIVFGNASGFGDIDVNASDFVSSGKGLRIYGTTAGDGTDMSVSGGADVNGDGFDDLILGTRAADTGAVNTTNEGEAIVVLGRGGPAAEDDIDLALPLGTGGFRIFGDDAADAAGRSVALAGDINGDGLADMMIGADGGDGRPGFVRSNSGEVVVLLGSIGAPGDVDLSTGSGNGFRIFGATNGDNAGFSISAAGDVNGDGYGDLLVGVPLGDGQAAPLNRSNSGEAVVVFGKASGFVDIDLNSNLAALGTGITIYGADVGDNLGRSVSSAGDINGDGYDDLVLGADLGDGADVIKTSAGEAVVVFGKATGWANLDVAALSVADGFRIYGADAGDEAGSAVSSAGDVNGDGYDDLLIGSPNADGASNAGNNEGEAVLVFGKAGGFSTIDLADNNLFASGQALRIVGASATDLAGGAVSAAGDINGDGFDDLIIGARNGDGLAVNRSNAGEAIVVFGGNLVAGDIVLGTTGSDTPIGTDTAAERIVTGQGNDTINNVSTGDVVQAGSGDDNVFLGIALDFIEIDGGSGQDLLALSGSGQSLDLGLSGAGERVSGFETIDITGAGDNTLFLDAASVLDIEGSGNLDFTFASSKNNLVVEGNAGDQVTLSTAGGGNGANWQQVENNVNLDGSNNPGGGYDLWQLTIGGTPSAVLAINANINVLDT